MQNSTRLVSSSVKVLLGSNTGSKRNDLWPAEELKELCSVIKVSLV